VIDSVDIAASFQMPYALYRVLEAPGPEERDRFAYKSGKTVQRCGRSNNVVA